MLVKTVLGNLWLRNLSNSTCNFNLISPFIPICWQGRAICIFSDISGRKRHCRHNMWWGTLWAIWVSEPAFPHWLLSSYEMVKDQRGVREWLRVDQSGCMLYMNSTKHLGECAPFISRLGVRHKLLKNYSRLQTGGRTTWALMLCPPAAIHQHGSKRDLKPRNSLLLLQNMCACLKYQPNVISCSNYT